MTRFEVGTYDDGSDSDFGAVSETPIDRVVS